MNKKEIPLYQKLMEDLKVSINNGDYNKGDLLPSENDLCQTYNTTRGTVRNALSGLRNLGYIVQKQGKGTIVSEPKKGLGILSLGGVTAGVDSENLTTAILQKQRTMKWPSDFFYSLNQEQQQKGCIFFTRLRCIDNIPVLYEETYITNFKLHNLIDINLENTSLFEILKKEYNLEVKKGEQKIWAKKSEKKICELLDMEKDSSVVHMKRKLYTNVQNLIIYSFIYCNTEEFFLEDSF